VAAPAPEAEPARWSAWMAFLTAWCLPATTARRTNHTHLAEAFAIHLASALLVFLLLCLFIGVAEVAGPVGIVGALVGMLKVLDDVLGDFARNPKETTLVLAGSAIFIELGFLALALLITPWGARDEPFRVSYTHALRRVWLHSAHGLVAVLLVGTWGTTLSRMDTAWHDAYPVAAPTWPAQPTGVPRDSQAWQDYQAAVQEASKQYTEWWQEIRRKKPWYLHHLEVSIGGTCILSALWLVWALLRAVGAPRRTPPIVRPPTCEACGYNLTTIPMESRCPECGEPVALSLGPAARPGTPWERRRELGRLTAWWQCCVELSRRPKQFARQIPVVSPGANHRRFLFFHLPIVFVIALVGLNAAFVIDTGRTPFTEAPEVAFGVFPMLSALVTLGAAALTLAAALLTGLWYAITDKRNLLPGSMQIACYLAGVLTLCIAFAWLTGLSVAALAEANVFQTLENIILVHDDLLTFLAWFMPNIVWLVGFFGLVFRATAGLRYANR
jgi:hypothetical protein